MSNNTNYKLSIIIPCYNEKETIKEIIDRINQINLGPIQNEIIIIDDYSTDGTKDILKNLKRQKNQTILYNSKNYGKGYCIRYALSHCTGNIIIIQDADLEYDPRDYPALIHPIITGQATVVYGSRERNKKNKTHSGVLFYLGGILVTKLTNILFNSNLTDQPTCYKVFKTDILKALSLHENRFGFCSEVTVQLLKKKIRIHEVPISYYPRKKHEGKKIGIKDACRAIYILFKYRLFNLQ